MDADVNSMKTHRKTPFKNNQTDNNQTDDVDVINRLYMLYEKKMASFYHSRRVKLTIDDIVNELHYNNRKLPENSKRTESDVIYYLLGRNNLFSGVRQVGSE